MNMCKLDLLGEEITIWYWFGDYRYYRCRDQRDGEPQVVVEKKQSESHRSPRGEQRRDRIYEDHAVKARSRTLLQFGVTFVRTSVRSFLRFSNFGLHTASFTLSHNRRPTRTTTRSNIGIIASSRSSRFSISKVKGSIRNIQRRYNSRTGNAVVTNLYFDALRRSLLIN